MQEQLISFETAKLAKEKGFGLSEEHYIKLPNWYTSEGEIKSSKPRVCKIHSRSWLGADTIEDFKATYELMDNSMDDLTLAPTQSLLQKWLRDTHEIHITLHKGVADKYWYKIFSHLYLGINNTVESKLYNNYEEALEIGLQEALKLIK